MHAGDPPAPGRSPTGVQTGGCLCGKIRFETSGDPRQTVYCHCFFCRRQTGAPVAAFAAFELNAGFRWSRGRPATYRSSPMVERRFCKACGTPLTFKADEEPGRIHIAISAFDDPDRFPPDAHHHIGHKIAWFDVEDALPRLRGAVSSDDR